MERRVAEFLGNVRPMGRFCSWREPVNAGARKSLISIFECDDSLGGPEGVTIEPGPSFACGCRWPISHHSVERGAAFGSESGAGFCSRTGRVLQPLLVPDLRVCSVSRAPSARCAGSHAELFLHLLEHKALTQVDPLRGKFRSFLLASVQNFLSDEADRARRKKRGGDREFVCMDAENAEERYRLEPVDYLTAETIFDARWAMTVLGEAMRRLRREYASGEETTTLEKLEPFVDPFNNRELTSYEQVASELQISLSAVKTLIHRLRKQYTGFLRKEVGRTVSDPGEIADEIHALCRALVASEGRLSP